MDSLPVVGKPRPPSGYAKQPGSSSVLLLTPTSTRPSPETLKKIDHEYSLRDEPNPAWVVGSLGVPEPTTLHGFLSGPMENRSIDSRFVSAHREALMRANALHAGAIPVLQKPFDNSALLDALRRSIR